VPKDHINIRGAPAIIAFIGNMENLNTQEQVDYIGEGIILKAKTMDLGVCNVERLAPSAVNGQPWRFQVNSNSITVSVNSLRREYEFSRLLDCGIAMLYVKVAALNGGIDGNWDFLKQPRVAKYAVKTK